MHAFLQFKKKKSHFENSNFEIVYSEKTICLYFQKTLGILMIKTDFPCLDVAQQPILS